MKSLPSLGEFEQIVLLAIRRLGEDAYGVTIGAEIAACTGREPAPGALYTTLDRLEDKQLLVSRLGDPTPQRGGRAKRYFTLNAKGLAAIVRAQQSYRRLMEGCELPGGQPCIVLTLQNGFSTSSFREIGPRQSSATLQNELSDAVESGFGRVL